MTPLRPPVPVTPELQAQCIPAAFDGQNAAAVARRPPRPPERVRRGVRAAAHRAAVPAPHDGRRALTASAAPVRQLQAWLGEKAREMAIFKDLVPKADRVPPRGVQEPLMGSPRAPGRRASAGWREWPDRPTPLGAHGPPGRRHLPPSLRPAGLAGELAGPRPGPRGPKGRAWNG